MFKPFLMTALLAAGVLSLASCESAPPAATDSQLTHATDEPIHLTEVPPPPGVPPQALNPFDESRQARAELTLTQVVASTPQPAHLSAPAQRPTPPSSNAPPLAAQKFYAQGRQALLEGDNFRAVQQFEKALRLSPGEPNILQSLGRAWTRAGNRVSAANHFRQAYTADPSDLDSLLMLGRFALNSRNWDLAIHNLDAALKIAEPLVVHNPAEVPDAVDTAAADPAAARLTRFYLANALNQAGYARAAVVMYLDYLNGDARGTFASRYARELSVIGAQQGETLTLIGDLHHRLDQPLLARDAYTRAAEVGVLNADALRRRMLYTRLRLGQPRAAEQLVAQAVAESPGDAKTLELIPYAAAQGVPVHGLTRRLTTQYESQGRPTSLALAMADVLPKDAATELLRSHLAERPGDDQVFGRLIELLVEQPALPEAYTQALRITAQAMAGSPDLAQNYADQFLANLAGLDTPAQQLAYFPEPADDDNHATAAAFQTLRGKLLIADHQPDAASAAFTRALDLDPQQTLARIELAELLLLQGEHQQAEAMLKALIGSNRPRVVMLRVRSLTETGRAEAALALLDEALRRTPPGSPLMLNKAALLVELDRPQEAERTLLDALNAQPTDERIYAALLQLYDDHSDLARNYPRLVRRMVETIPNARLTQLVKIEHLLASRKYNDAERILKTLEKKQDGKNNVIDRMWLEIYIGTRRTDKATALIDQHLAEAGGGPDDKLIDTAIAFFNRIGEKERAADLEERRWLAAAPSLQRSRRLSSIYYLRGDYDQASQVLREALKQDFAKEQPQPLLLMLIECENKLGHYEQSIQIAQQAIDGGRAGNETTRFWTVLIQSFFLAERYDDAAQTAAQAIDQEQLEPEPGFFLALLVESLFELERFEDAEQRVLQTMQKHPDRGGDLAIFMANLYQQRGHEERSLGFMGKALEAFPQHAGLNNSLGYSLASSGKRLDEAQQMIAVAVAGDPTSAAYLDSMGWVFYKKGQFAQAKQWLERGRKARGGDHVVIVDHLGDALYRLDRKAEAVRIWRDVQQMLSAAGYEKTTDPEEDGLLERVQNKIKAVAEARPAPVAELGQGVTPAAPAPPADAPPLPAVAPKAVEM